jgi:hypothetical protein
MNRNETFREYFRRARTDPTVRAQLLGNARYTRSVFGWLTLFFGILAFWQFGYQLWKEGVWISRLSIVYTFSFTTAWLIYDKFGDRVAVLAAMDDPRAMAPEFDEPPAKREVHRE